MTETALRQENTHATVLPARDERVETLLGSILRNRFLPEPNPDSVFVGDGDFRAVGVEFLGHFIRLAGYDRKAAFSISVAASVEWPSRSPSIWISKRDATAE